MMRLLGSLLLLLPLPTGGDGGVVAAAVAGDGTATLLLHSQKLPPLQPWTESTMEETKRGDRVRGPVGNTL